MKSSFGTALSYTLFGESHGSAIGITIQGIPAGVHFDLAAVDVALARRQGGASFNTPRQEKTTFEIVSGYFQERTTGTPLTVIFRNENTRSRDYSALVEQPRPGHADYVASVKYNGSQDFRGGGHFSGRLTTPIVFLGAIAKQYIQQIAPEYDVRTAITTFGGISSPDYYAKRMHAIAATFNQPMDSQIDVTSLLKENSIEQVQQQAATAVANVQTQWKKLDPRFPVLDKERQTEMEAAAVAARNAKDSLGGHIQTVVMHAPLAIGEPYFHSIESTLAALLYSVGTVKMVSFGYGEQFSHVLGSAVKDEIMGTTAAGIQTLFNFNGGINGGISNGEDIVLGVALKPIASILQKQETLNVATGEVSTLEIKGRHDATIINRVIPVVEAMVHIGLLDLWLQKK